MTTPTPNSTDKASPRKPQGLCDVTLTERFENKACCCPTYEGNLGPCQGYDLGANGRCVYCDHSEACHG